MSTTETYNELSMVKLMEQKERAFQYSADCSPHSPSCSNINEMLHNNDVNRVDKTISSAQK